MQSIVAKKILKGNKMTKSRKTAPLRAVSVLGLSVLVGLALSFEACAPRSATMCVNPTTNEWVKCPAGVAPGTTLEAGQAQATKAKTQNTKKKATTKKRTTTKK